MKVLYTAVATAVGGRAGQVHSSDGALKARLSVPAEMGGPRGGDGTNPEQLFAAGYAACFGSSVEYVARQAKQTVPPEVRVTARVGIGPRAGGGFALSVVLEVELPGIPASTARELVDAAHRVCPYSNAIRGNVNVEIMLGSTLLRGDVDE